MASQNGLWYLIVEAIRTRLKKMVWNVARPYTVKKFKNSRAKLKSICPFCRQPILKKKKKRQMKYDPSCLNQWVNVLLHSESASDRFQLDFLLKEYYSMHGLQDSADPGCMYCLKHPGLFGKWHMINHFIVLWPVTLFRVDILWSPALESWESGLSCYICQVFLVWVAPEISDFINYTI